MVYVGPFDFSIAMGHPGDYEHPDVAQPMSRILELSRKHRVPFGTTVSNAEIAAQWVRRGCSFFMSSMNSVCCGKELPKRSMPIAWSAAEDSQKAFRQYNQKMPMLNRSEDYDRFCQQKLADPYPLFDELREKDPVHWCEPLGSWLSTRYADAYVGLNDARLLGGRRSMYAKILNNENREKASALVDHVDLWLQNQKPPSHTRLRKLAGAAFTPRQIKDLSPRIDRIVREKLEAVRAKGHCDFVTEFCYWVPATVICDMLGLPQTDHEYFQRLMADLVPFTSAAGPQVNAAVEPGYRAMQEMLAYFSKKIEDRRRSPGSDVLSALVHAEVDGDCLSEEELFALCIFLFVAGHETTASLLANGTMLLLTHPDQLAILKSRPQELLDTAIEELIRFESPVTRAIRHAVEDVKIGDRSLRAGDTIVFLIGAVNRDPAQFPAPEKLNIQRAPNKHLGFGWGRHFCLGAELARLEARIAFPLIFQLLPNLRLTDELCKWRPIFGIRSLSTLPIRVD